MTYLKQLEKEQKNLSAIVRESSIIRVTCAACGRLFWATEASYVANVQAGKLESLCGGCDGSHGEE